MLTSTQELRHSTRNFLNLAGDYLGEGSPVCVSMVSWPRHIDRFEQKYDNAFARDPLFGADLMDLIHKHVQMFLHSWNMPAIEDVESGALTEFGGLQKWVERGECLTSTPGWVNRPAPKDEGHRKSSGHGIGSSQSDGGGGREAVFNNRVKPQLRIMKILGEMTAEAHSENLH